MLVDLIMWSRNSFSFVIDVLTATWQEEVKRNLEEKVKLLTTKYTSENIKQRENEFRGVCSKDQMDSHA